MSRIPRPKTANSENVENVHVGLPPPDFNKVHKSWQLKFDEGVRSTKKPTTKVKEFGLSSGRPREMSCKKKTNQSTLHRGRLTNLQKKEEKYDDDVFDFSKMPPAIYRRIFQPRDEQDEVPAQMQRPPGSRRTPADCLTGLENKPHTNNAIKNFNNDSPINANCASPDLPTRDLCGNTLTSQFAKNPSTFRDGDVTKAVDFASNEDCDQNHQRLSNLETSDTGDKASDEDLQKIHELEEQLAALREKIKTKSHRDSKNQPNSQLRPLKENGDPPVAGYNLEEIISGISAAKLSSKPMIPFEIGDPEEQKFIQKVRHDIYNSNQRLIKDRERLANTKVYTGTERMEQWLKRNSGFLKIGCNKSDDNCPLKTKYLKLGSEVQGSPPAQPAEDANDKHLSCECSDIASASASGIEDSTDIIPDEQFSSSSKVTHRRGVEYTDFMVAGAQHYVENPNGHYDEESLPRNTIQARSFKMKSIPATPKNVVRLRNMLDTPALVESIRSRLISRN